jgi:hypothetical protein
METTYQEETQPKYDEDWHFFFIRHVHLPQGWNNDQQDGQIRGDVENCLNNFVVEIRGALFLRRWNGKVSRKWTTVREESELDSDISCQGISGAEFDPELP